MRRKTFAALAVSGLMATAFAPPLEAQQAGPAHAGYDPNAPTDGHVHEGELGAKLMLIETALKCNCGCGLDVHTCQFSMRCGESPGWTARIMRELEAGMEPEAIKAGFVADYGGTVLMSPPPEGFNLLGYLLPGFAILTAGMLVGIIARGGRSREALAPIDDVSAEDAERLRAEWEKLEEAESPDW